MSSGDSRIRRRHTTSVVTKRPSGLFFTNFVTFTCHLLLPRAHLLSLLLLQCLFMLSELSVFFFQHFYAICDAFTHLFVYRNSLSMLSRVTLNSWSSRPYFLSVGIMGLYWHTDLHNSSIPYCIHDVPVFKRSYSLSLLALNAINSEAYEVDAKFSSTFSVFALVQVLGNDYPVY